MTVSTRIGDNSRKLRRTLFAFAFVLALLGPTGESSAHVESRSQHPGLAGYGLAGPIERSMLPAGLRDQVSNETLVLANSAQLATSRSGWVGEIVFVGQLDYQLEFRGHTDYLSTEEEHLNQLLTDRPINVRYNDLRLYMTKVEAAEFERRLELGTVMEAIEEEFAIDSSKSEAEEVSYEAGFVGVWQDQLNGGEIVLSATAELLVDLNRLRDLGATDSVVRVVRQQDSMAELREIRKELGARIASAGLDATVDIIPTSGGFEVQIVGPRVESLDDPVLNEIASDDAVRVVQGEVPNEAGNPQDTHSWGDQQPGLAIQRYGSGAINCGWGFNGHSSNYHYIISAGHCGGSAHQNVSGEWLGTEFEISQTHQNSHPRNLTPGNTFVSSMNNLSYDVLRAESMYANDNCYHGQGNASNAHCEWPMASRASHNSWEPGNDTTCNSLSKSNTYKCGFIEAENQCGINTGGACRLVRVGFGAQVGDSGAGSKCSYTADGILVETNSTQHWIQTAYDVKRKLGIDFNCASSEQTKSPSSWGNCPIVNR